MKKIQNLLVNWLVLVAMILIIFTGCKKDENDPAAIKDIDGNIYTSVTIGNQEWLKENLRTTTLYDGTSIPLITDNTEWSELSTMAYSWYDNNPSEYKNTFGALYNWYAVRTGKLCPEGWHVPSLSEFIELADFLGGVDVAGGKMKETGYNHWLQPNEGATNESGFTGLGHGQRNPDGSYDYKFEYGEYWSSTEASSTTAHNPGLVDFDSKLYNSSTSISKDKEAGLAVRCVKN